MHFELLRVRFLRDIRVEKNGRENAKQCPSLRSRIPTLLVSMFTILPQSQSMWLARSSSFLSQMELGAARQEGFTLKRSTLKYGTRPLVVIEIFTCLVEKTIEMQFIRRGWELVIY